MKNTIKLLFLGLFLFGITATRSQISTSTGGAANVLPNVPTSNSNIGIGTTNPVVKLDLGSTTNQEIGVKTALSNYAFYGTWQDDAIIAINRRPSNGTFSQTTKGAASINLNSNTSGSYIKFTTNNIVNTLGEERMRIIENGNVGIGTATPYTKLEVVGVISSGVVSSAINLGMEFGGLLSPSALPSQIRGVIGALNSGTGVLAGSIGYQPRTGVGASHIFFNERVETFRITSTGNVGIGSKNPDEKLTVKGKIHAEEIIVDLAVPADYVFEKYYTGKSELKSGYSLPTLAEIENFTKENHHLPNVPSAQEIQQNGLPLGEMSNVLLQKVEELTLYAIEQQKEIDRLKTENENYKSLVERISILEKSLNK